MMSVLRPVVLIIVLTVSACGEQPSPGVENAPSSGPDFESLLMATLDPETTDPAAGAFFEAAAARFAALREEPDTEDGEIRGLAVAPPPSQICAGEAAATLPGLTERIRSESSRIAARLESCVAQCPALACERYADATIAMERSAQTAAALTDRLSGMAVVEEGSAAAAQSRWQADARALTRETTGALVDLAGRIAREDPLTDRALFEALARRYRVLATQAADMMWADHLQGTGASPLVADLESVAGRFAVLATLLPASAETGVPRSDTLLSEMGDLVADAGTLSMTSGERIDGLAIAEPAAASSDACLVPLSRSLAAVQGELGGVAPRLRQCASARSCPGRPQLSLDMHALARMSLSEATMALDADAQALDAVATDMADSACE